MLPTPIVHQAATVESSSFLCLELEPTFIMGVPPVLWIH